MAWLEVADRVVVGVGQGAAAGKLIGEGAPAVRGGKRVAGELR